MDPADTMDASSPTSPAWVTLAHYTPLRYDKMFKKKPTIKPLAPLRSSDRRKLADLIIKEYNLESSTNGESSAQQTPEEKTEAVNARTSLRSSLLPDNIQTARFTTTHGPDLKQTSGWVWDRCGCRMLCDDMLGSAQ